MKLLFDQNLSFQLCKLLEDLFPGSVQAYLIGLSAADDLTIWNYAKAGEFVIVSLDSDFAELAAMFGAPPKVVWLRCGNQTTSVIHALLRNHAAVIRAFAREADAACLEIY